MILFSNIFDRAIMLFDDPDINRAYENDPVSFQKIMLPYLINGKDQFSSPLEITRILATYSNLISEECVMDGNGTATYTVDEGFQPIENSVLSFRINGKPDPEAIYDSGSRQVTFSKKVSSKEKCSIEYCFAGAFTEEVSWSYNAKWLSDKVIRERVIDILAHCTLLAWCQREQNFVLDIRNLLTDTDFKMYSPGNSVKSKVAWYTAVKQELDDLTNKLNWDMRGTRKGHF